MTPDLSVTKLGWAATVSSEAMEDARALREAEAAWLALSPAERAKRSREARAAVAAMYGRVLVGLEYAATDRVFAALRRIAERHAPDDRGNCQGAHDSEYETGWRDCPEARDVAAAVGIEMVEAG